MTRRFSRRNATLGLVALGAVSVSCRNRGGLKWANSSAPSLRVNQVGYFPEGPKWATLKNDSKRPLAIELLSEGKVLWNGTSIPHGFDPASGDHVHHVDFSAFNRPGQGYVLRTENDESFPFNISPDIYESLPYDALKYFYHNRSGAPIVQPYVSHATWTRPAGHLSDADVGCWGSQECDYRLDVSGGWYDAGDHGKYVVNGGISAWTLLSMYERFVFLGEGIAPYADGKLRIPESGNGVPDLLDEVRFELEFLLKMQVPPGRPLEGMVHHKIHDHAWTPLAIEPPPHTDIRALHPPSTAATLNLAAVAAKAARIFGKYDRAFADYCLNTAQRAYVAALEHPELYASKMDDQGGGAYSDDIVTDEFFWAATELAITTGHEAYWVRLRRSKHYEEFPTALLTHPNGTIDGDGVTSSMTWQSTAALGWISLATAPNELPEKERRRAVTGILHAGDVYLEILKSEGYLLPLELGESQKYPWGSNSFVLNNMLVLSLAYDLSKETKYADGVAMGMDYLLGRNPLQKSYISGYGEVPLEHPHHRFWAHQKSTRFPPPPPGAISGGPNSSLQDPQTRRSGLRRGLPPQKCYVDHIEAWSVNEVAINWNAPLSWTAAFLNEWRGQG